MHTVRIQQLEVYKGNGVNVVGISITKSSSHNGGAVLPLLKYCQVITKEIVIAAAEREREESSYHLLMDFFSLSLFLPKKKMNRSKPFCNIHRKKVKRVDNQVFLGFNDDHTKNYL